MLVGSSPLAPASSQLQSSASSEVQLVKVLFYTGLVGFGGEHLYVQFNFFCCLRYAAAASITSSSLSSAMQRSLTKF